MEKEQFLELKETLKRKAQEQKEVKAQRKTKNFKGTRKTSAYDAAEQARHNREWLDKMYVVYYMAKHQVGFIPMKEFSSDPLQKKAQVAANEALLRGAYERTHGRSLEHSFVYGYQESDYLYDLTHLAHETYKEYAKVK